MNKFNLPYFPWDDYDSFIIDQQSNINTIYFGLNTMLIADARYSKTITDKSEKDILSHLSNLLPNITDTTSFHKYGLMNTRVHAPYFYEKSQTFAVLDILKSFIDANVIDGIIYSDHYYVKHLSKFSKDITSQLEAVPSINWMFDSATKVDQFYQYLGDTHFKEPSKLILDRSLNRNMVELKSLSTHIKKTYPNVNIELLVNEGCLYQCPFKTVHDCFISMTHIPNNISIKNTVGRINVELGCIDQLLRYPFYIFKSPFIRPEDIHEYSTFVDSFKIAGRTGGHEYIKFISKFYFNEKYDDNLAFLLDSTRYFTDKLYIFNDNIPNNFNSTVSSCDKNCFSCGYCENLFNDPNIVQILNKKFFSM